jgi:hypothetical protein
MTVRVVVAVRPDWSVATFGGLTCGFVFPMRRERRECACLSIRELNTKCVVGPPDDATLAEVTTIGS